MLFMHKCKENLDFYGILSGNWRRFLYMPYFIAQIIMIYAKVCFLIIKTPSVYEASMVIYVAFAIIGIWGKMTLLMRNRRKARMFVMRFEQLLESFIQTSSTTDAAYGLFSKTEKELTKYSRLYMGASIVSCIFYYVMPYATWIYYYFSGTLDHDKMVAPFHDMYLFFDAAVFPMREIAYVWNGVGLFFLTFAYAAVDMLYMATSLYVVCTFDYLKMEVNNLDQMIIGRKRFDAVMRCVRVHQNTLWIIDDFNELYSSIVFLQFGYSVVCLVTSVLTAIYAEPSFLSLIALNYMILVSELYLFNLMGTLVVAASNSVKNAVYSVGWYEYTNAEQQALRLMMLRTNIEAGFGAYRFFICSHESFSAIMSKVYSLLAFLQNIIE